MLVPNAPDFLWVILLFYKVLGGCVFGGTASTMDFSAAITQVS